MLTEGNETYKIAAVIPTVRVSGSSSRTARSLSLMDFVLSKGFEGKEGVKMEMAGETRHLVFCFWADHLLTFRPINEPREPTPFAPPHVRTKDNHLWIF